RPAVSLSGQPLSALRQWLGRLASGRCWRPCSPPFSESCPGTAPVPARCLRSEVRVRAEFPPPPSKLRPRRIPETRTRYESTERIPGRTPVGCGRYRASSSPLLVVMNRQAAATAQAVRDVAHGNLWAMGEPGIGREPDAE